MVGNGRPSETMAAQASSDRSGAVDGGGASEPGSRLLEIVGALAAELHPHLAASRLLSLNAWAGSN